jgi:hypothetical protein
MLQVRLLLVPPPCVDKVPSLLYIPRRVAPLLKEPGMGENEAWCQAWRLLVKHRDAADDVIAAEIERCERKRDDAGAAFWRKVLSALDDFR